MCDENGVGDEHDDGGGNDDDGGGGHNVEMMKITTVNMVIMWR